MRAQTGQDKNTRSDDRPYAQRRQLKGSKRPLQTVFAAFLCFIDQ